MEKSIIEVFGEKSKDSDELVAHTLQSIANMQRGDWEDILYKIQTKGGEDRYIHKGIDGLPKKDRREWQTNILRSQIQQDPSFADTLSYQKGMEMVAPEKSISSKLLKALGIYKNGGEVSALSGLERLGGGSMTDHHNKRLTSILEDDNEWGFNVADLVGDILEAKDYKDKNEPGWNDPKINGNKGMGGRGGGYELEKTKGLMGLLQRLLPGGKTGYNE